MSAWSSRTLGALAWVTVVGAGALLVWVVISRAGAGLVAEPGPVTVPSGTTAAVGDGLAGTPGVASRATWQGEAGAVTAACQGADISLVAAQPGDESTVRVLDKGPVRLVVSFEGAEHHVTVVGRCRDGRPQLSATAQPPDLSTSTPSPTQSPTPAPGGGNGTDEPGQGSGSGHGSDDHGADDPGEPGDK